MGLFDKEFIAKIPTPVGIVLLLVIILGLGPYLGDKYISWINQLRFMEELRIKSIEGTSIDYATLIVTRLCIYISPFNIIYLLYLGRKNELKGSKQILNILLSPVFLILAIILFLILRSLFHLTFNMLQLLCIGAILIAPLLIIFGYISSHIKRKTKKER